MPHAIKSVLHSNLLVKTEPRSRNSISTDSVDKWVWQKARLSFCCVVQWIDGFDTSWHIGPLFEHSVLSSNQIEDLPAKVFQGLKSLQNLWVFSQQHPCLWLYVFQQTSLLAAYNSLIYICRYTCIRACTHIHTYNYVHVCILTFLSQLVVVGL
jgi:hypothetical protein